MGKSVLKQVEPTYPPLAKAAELVGTVFVGVTVDERGDVISAEALEGHSMLKDAALEAARGWKFKSMEEQRREVEEQRREGSRIRRKLSIPHHY
jgi:TonB family protein